MLVEPELMEAAEHSSQMGNVSRADMSTQIENGLNSILRHVGLQVTTTREQNAEAARLAHIAKQGHWETPRYAHGLDLNVTRFREVIQSICLPFNDDFAGFATHNGNGNFDFPIRNGWFESIDAQMLYSLIRV